LSQAGYAQLQKTQSLECFCASFWMTSLRNIPKFRPKIGHCPKFSRVKSDEKSSSSNFSSKFEEKLNKFGLHSRHLIVDDNDFLVQKNYRGIFNWLFPGTGLNSTDFKPLLRKIFIQIQVEGNLKSPPDKPLLWKWEKLIPGSFLEYSYRGSLENQTHQAKLKLNITSHQFDQLTSINVIVVLIKMCRMLMIFF
jgi:hypothetical protein